MSDLAVAVGDLTDAAAAAATEAAADAEHEAATAAADAELAQQAAEAAVAAAAIAGSVAEANAAETVAAMGSRVVALELEIATCRNMLTELTTRVSALSIPPQSVETAEPPEQQTTIVSVTDPAAISHLPAERENNPENAADRQAARTSRRLLHRL
jgi:hypothetical protein